MRTSKLRNDKTATMKDQYSHLRAIDTSSSSPQLLNEAEAALRRGRQKTPQQRLNPIELSSQLAKQSNGQTPTATNSSSSINSKAEPTGKLEGNILTNLVKFPGRQQQQQVLTMKKSQTEKCKPAGDLRDKLFSLTGGKQHLKPATSQGGAKPLGAPKLSQPPMAAPTSIRSQTRHLQVPAVAAASSHRNKITASDRAGKLLNYPMPSDTTQQQQQQAQPELAKCYDEIDQIYDYIRGLAPLPVQLRKIKSIDFEQLERDRQKLAERQQKLQVQHHQHRERYVRSIDDSTSHSQASVASTQPSGGAPPAKRLVKIRQRDASEQNSVRPPPLAAGPMPIRVTTRSSESARPSIKRVESLNLGQAGSAEQQANPNSLSVSRPGQPLMAAALTKPSYLISTTQRGQVFRLPRAHSTSTLNKPAPAVASSRRASQAQIATPRAETGARLRLAGRHLSRASPGEPQTGGGSLSRSTGRRVPGFESDLVESFVDDDEMSESDERQVAGDDQSVQFQNSSSSSSPSSARSSGERDDAEAKQSGGSSQASERLSQSEKSHSDYDNDFDANTSETTSTETSSDTKTTNTTSNDDEDDDDEKHRDDEQELELEEIRARARALKRDHSHHHSAGKTSSSMSPFSGGGGGGGSSSTGKRSQRPTTSSSPSSGRPASPADETQPESDGPEASIGRESTRHRRSTSSYRREHHLPMGSTQPTRREEHIYEQIPAHKTHGSTTTTTTTSRVLCADQPIGMTTATSQSTLSRRAPGAGDAQKPIIKHPVAYAANVAVNKRYQQQVAALFALQQRRDRQLAASQPPLPPVALHVYHQGHRRRASASNTQYLPQWRQATSSSNHHHHHHHHHQQQLQHLSSLPHRNRLSMGNIHLLTSAIPLASLYSPKTQNVPSSGEIRAKDAERHRRRAQTNANSLDDHEAGSTGTTNSTSSYEAAIKNSEPNPLRIDMLAPTPDGAPEQRHSAGRRSVGSGSGSRSLSNHLQMHNSAIAGTHHLHQQPQQHSSSLVKVPKLSRQSHLLQRPLPKPPNHHRSSSSCKQLTSKSAALTNRTITTKPPVIDAFN